LALVLWDLGLVEPKDKDSKYHFKLAYGNLKDLLKQLKIKEYDEE
jgi:hypothetical protein